MLVSLCYKKQAYVYTNSDTLGGTSWLTSLLHWLYTHTHTHRDQSTTSICIHLSLFFVT